MIEIIKNTMVEPIKVTCGDCESVFTYNYEDVQTDTSSSLLGVTYYNRYVTCPVCKYRNFIKAVKASEVE